MQRTMRKVKRKFYFSLLLAAVGLVMIILFFPQTKVINLTTTEDESRLFHPLMMELDHLKNMSFKNESYHDKSVKIIKTRIEILQRLLNPTNSRGENPVVEAHLVYLKHLQNLKWGPTSRNISTAAKRHLQNRNVTLTSNDRTHVARCKNDLRQYTGINYNPYINHYFQKTNKSLMRFESHTYLNRHSLVIEVGGNIGNCSNYFLSKYNPRYIVLEPLERYSVLLQQKFGRSNYLVYNLGLGKTNESFLVNFEGFEADATSVFSLSNRKGEIPIFIMDAISFLTHLGVGVFDVDLFTLNCEGCEFDVLESILSTNLILNMRNIQWATHYSVDVKDKVLRYCKILQLLSTTHRPIYQHKIIWESWRRKDIE